MPACARCGKENAEDARFCSACGAALAAEAPPREVRKTVTVVFCDVSGSTALGERLDPESLRALLARYFEAMKEVLERHGGTVEKFIGDAVMAVFGVPVLHEDDALRAVRAAVEMREALPALGLEARIGVNTGEVVTGTEERLATGDAVNVAARLEQAAAPGEILLGAETLRLVRDAVQVEPLTVEAKGKAEPVQAYRLLALTGAEAFRRRLDAPMVGRERERRLLEQAFERAVSDGACHLFTILGAAGVGKSRLAEEFLHLLEGEATILRGRCLSYGEGITFWPLTEILQQLEQPAEFVEVAAAPEEIFWAARKLLEGVARERPLVLVFDDLHWGEPTFLDLVEHVADWSRDAPILLVCLARPELLDQRPAWGGGKLNATSVLLEPLSADECERLIDSLLGEARLDEALRARIADAAEGNPLFVEEMLAMLDQSANGDVAIPPTIQALLAARLDQLPEPERAVLECAAVEGKVFHQSAVLELAPEEPQVGTRLMALVRKELIRPERPSLPGEEAFRFRHLLIRDAAYEALPKQIRAELHERFAGWLERRGRELVERDELVGYHLERAYRYRAELGPMGERARELARQAGKRLAAAGARAFARSDMPAAVSLLSRAAELLPPDDPARLELLPDLAAALAERGELAKGEALLAEAIGAAQASGDERLEARARLARVDLGVQTGTGMHETLAGAERAIGVFERLGDELGLARAWNLVGKLRFWLGQTAAGEAAYEQAIAYAERAGARRVRAESLAWAALLLMYGPTPAAEGLRRCDELLARSGGEPSVESWVLVARSAFEAMQGRFDEARALRARSKAIHADLGLRLGEAGAATAYGEVELLAGDPAAAEAEFRGGYEVLEQMGERGYRSSLASQLAEALYLQGRYEEADRLTRIGEEAAAPDDFDAQLRWRAVRAKVLARWGELEQARALAGEAVAIVEPTDFLDLHAEALMDLAEVLRLGGQQEEARPLVEEARGLYERKGNLVMAERARALLG